MKKNVLAVLLGFFLSALMVLVLMPFGLGNLIMAQSIRVSYWTALMKDVDHRPKPGSEPGLNRDNIRAWREADSIRPDDFNIVFLGDSFVFGYFLDVRESPPAILESLLREHYQTDRINVWNFGWVSSSPYLQWRQLQDLGPRYQPDLVLQGLDMTDFRDDFIYRNLIEGRGIYQYVRQYPVVFFHTMEIVRYFPSLYLKIFGYPPEGHYFITRQPLADSSVFFADVKDSLDRIHQYSQEAFGAPFASFIFPRHWQYTDREAPLSWERGSYDVLGPYVREPFRYFEGVADSTPYPIISLLGDFQETDQFPLCQEADSHWNPAGARFAAEAIFRHCLAIGCFAGLEASLAGMAAQPEPQAPQALAPTP